MKAKSSRSVVKSERGIPAIAAARATARSPPWASIPSSWADGRRADLRDPSVAEIRLAANMPQMTRWLSCSLRWAFLAISAVCRPAKPDAASRCASSRIPMGEISSLVARFSHKWRSNSVGEQISNIDDQGKISAPRPPDGLGTTISQPRPDAAARIRALSNRGVVKGTVAPLSRKLVGSKLSAWKRFSAATGLDIQEA